VAQKSVRRWVLRVAVGAVALSVLPVVVLRWVPPLTTSFMVARWVDGVVGRRPTVPVQYAWVPWPAIAPAMKLAVVAAEDQRFPTHYGFDLGAIRNLPFLVSLGIGGDDHVLSRVVRFFESKGYRVHGAGDVAPELLAGEGKLGDKAPSAEDRADISTGFRVVSALGRLDVGQAAVVAKSYVLAVEAAEGTDAMLARCAGLREIGRIKQRARSGVLVKAPKPGQEERVDLPTIGPETVRNAATAGLAGIAVAAGRVLMAEHAATIAAANQHGLFLVGERLTDEGDA